MAYMLPDPALGHVMLEQQLPAVVVLMLRLVCAAPLAVAGKCLSTSKLSAGRALAEFARDVWQCCASSQLCCAGVVF